MTLDAFQRTDLQTSLGPIQLFSTPEVAGVLRPQLLLLSGLTTDLEQIAHLADNLGILAGASIVQLPTLAGSNAAQVTAAAVSMVIDELIARRFPARRIVLAGFSAGAVIALGARSPNIVRIVAVEPPLVVKAVQPIPAGLDDALQVRRDPFSRKLMSEILGACADRVEARDRTDLLDRWRVPVEIVAGAIVSGSAFSPTHPPSLVGGPERRLAADRAGTRLHIIPGVGHDILGEAPRALREIILEACRRAGRGDDPARLALDEPLLEAAPLTARRMAYFGPQGEAFADALRRENPTCDIKTVEDVEAPEVESRLQGQFDAFVFARAPPLDALGRLVGRLGIGGHVIARWPRAAEDLDRQLADLGLRLRSPTEDAPCAIVRAQRLETGARAQEPLVLQIVAYAPLLMDIRTRLPARGLRTDPDLSVIYLTPPTRLLPLPPETPKVLVIQRPAEARIDSWRQTLAQAIRGGWLIVMEYDDYPPLIAETLGRPRSDDDMKALGYAHAVQTSTPRLTELFRPYNPEVALFPNSAFELFPFPSEPRPPRVFYGAVTRGEYAVRVAASLQPALERHPEAEFIVLGDQDVFRALPTDNKRYHGYLSFEGYLDVMRHCSVSLSPIESRPMLDTKSDAKFIDAAACGALTIASPTIYDQVIDHGINGLLAPQVADWAPRLLQALGDEPARARMAKAAWDYVRIERMFADQAARRREWYFDLWSRRDALNAAAIDRVPGLREMLAG